MIPIPNDRLARVRALFEDHFERHGELGAAVSIWQGDEEILHLSAGHRDRAKTFPWDAETLVPVWSCTKGPAAACVLAALGEADLTVDDPVAKIWPEFAKAEKSAVTFRHILSHQAGLSTLDEHVPMEDHHAVIRAIESQAPQWPLGEGHGYHPRTYGFLVGEIVRRVAKVESLGRYWFENFAEPLGWDLWIGLPESEHQRVATLVPGKISKHAPKDEARFYQAFADAESLTRRSFTSPHGLHAVADMNQPSAWMVGYPAMGGVASARGLAAFYAVLANGGQCAGRSFFNRAQLKAMSTVVTSGNDKVLLRQTAFAAGFMKDPINAEDRKSRQLFGPNIQAFGHPGAGGSHAFADPETGIGFAYVMNQMERSVFPTERTLGLVRALYGQV